VAHRWIAANCDGCHTNTEWVPATCDHRKTFRFDSHHKPNCRTCHSDGDYRKFTCYGCHEHSAAKVERKHIREGIRDFQKCAQCHRSASTREARRNLRLQEGGGPVRRGD
jgi:NAD-dependent SIR2 family protein deacetylase